VQWSGYGEWIAIGRQAAVTGEILVLDIDEGSGLQRLAVSVIESRPVMLEGRIRHRIRLRAAERPPVLFEQQARGN
jgi:hypothetical protein